MIARRFLAIGLLGFAFLAISASAASAQSGVSRAEAIKELDQTRVSIDETLALFKAGKAKQALQQAQDGYLSHFERVEIPLRVADADLTLDAEQQFAEIRGLIRDDASTSDVRAAIVDLRGLVDSAERRLTDPGLGAPAIVFTQSFLIIFREGLEAVLLLSVLIGFLEATKATQFKRPILYGVGLALVATAATVFLLQALFAIAPASREVMSAVTALVAVALLFWVSFWLIARLEHRRWMEFLKARVWTAVSIGSTASLILIGFTAVYREGFETVLFYQALLSFGTGLGIWMALGFVCGVVALTACGFAIFRLGRRLPIKAFLSVAVGLIMLTSVAFLGNAVAALQEADAVGYTRLEGWPRLPIYLAEATGYRPTTQTVVAQIGLILVYLLGALYMFVVQPRLRRTAPPVPTPAPEPADGDTRVELEPTAPTGTSR
jgi:high-affinity iron transporter